MGGSFDGTGSFTAATVDDAIALDIGGSANAWGGAATMGTYSANTFTEESTAVLGFSFDTAFASNDRLNTNGATSIAGALDLFDDSGNALNLSDLDGSHSYVLISDASGLVSGAFTSTNVTGLNIGADPPGWNVVFNGAGAPSGGGDVELDFVTPEPSTYALFAMALLAMALLHRNRRALTNAARRR